MCFIFSVGSGEDKLSVLFLLCLSLTLLFDPNELEPFVFHLLLIRAVLSKSCFCVPFFDVGIVFAEEDIFLLLFTAREAVCDRMRCMFVALSHVDRKVD